MFAARIVLPRTPHETDHVVCSGWLNKELPHDDDHDDDKDENDDDDDDDDALK